MLVKGTVQLLKVSPPLNPYLFSWKNFRLLSQLGKRACISGKTILQQYFGIPKRLKKFSQRSGQSFPVLHSWFINRSITLSVQKHRSPNCISESQESYHSCNKAQN